MSSDSCSQKTEEETGLKPGEEEKQRKNQLLSELRQFARKPLQDEFIGRFPVLSDLMSGRLHLPKKTVVSYDLETGSHMSEWDEEHSESPDRLQVILERCGELLEQCTLLPSREAMECEMFPHTEQYISLLGETETMSHEKRKQLCERSDSVFINEHTYRAARLSLGCMLNVVDAVLKGQALNGMALTRPPGHHALPDRPCGYSFINYVACAAHRALDSGLQRVLIVDWDVHHGQATQQMFYDDPRVLYFSLHRYEDGKFWPHLRESDFDYIGNGRGTGYNINVPLNQTGMTSSDYLAAFYQLLLPVAYEFSPEIVIVSAGFDCVFGDYKGEMNVAPQTFSHVTRLLSGLAEGKLAICLEGGYQLDALSEGVDSTLRALLGQPCPSLGSIPRPSDSMRETLINCINVLRNHWSSLCHQPEVEAVDRCSQLLFTPPRGDDFQPLRPAEGTVFSLLDGARASGRESQSVRDQLQKWRDALLQDLSATQNRVALFYDEKMKAHSLLGHVERPSRISSIRDLMNDIGLLDRMVLLQTAVASDKELLLLHEQNHVDFMRDTLHKSDEELERIASKHSSVYFSQTTEACARLSAGGTLECVRAVVQQKVARSALAVVRPPGHHAEAHCAMGFCFYNNVALAARYATDSLGLKRVLIVDWDIHHGNGIQRMLYSDPRVLYISLHRYENGFFYPGNTQAGHDHVGVSEGLGFNVNIPFNQEKMGDAEYVAAFEQVVMPISMQFDPELVLVSAGFDAALGDPLGGYRVTPMGYAQLTNMLLTLAGGRLVMVLEGGYNLTSISESMTMCASVMLGDPCPPLGPLQAPNKSACKTITAVIQTHSVYWDSLAFSEPMVSLADRTQQSTETDLSLERSASSQASSSAEHLPTQVAQEPCWVERDVSVAARSSQAAEGGTEAKELKEQGPPRTERSPSSGLSAEEGAQWAKSTALGAVGGSQSAEAGPSGTEKSPLGAEGGRPSAEAGPSGTEKSPLGGEGRRPSAEAGPSGTERGPLGTEGGRPSAEAGPSGTEKSPLGGEGGRPSAEAGPSGTGGGCLITVGGSIGAECEGAVGGVEATEVPSDEFILQLVQQLGGLEMHAVWPKSWCPHLKEVTKVPERGLSIKEPCIDCGNVGENWVCLVCYKVYCSRYVNEHMLLHALDSAHSIVLSYADLSAWCYKCDSYVHNEVLLPAKESAHISKFGVPFSH